MLKTHGCGQQCGRWRTGYKRVASLFDFLSKANVCIPAICISFVIFTYVSNISRFSFHVLTNNDCEGWHRRLNTRARRAKLPFYVLLPPPEERSGPSQPAVPARRRRTNDIVAKEGIKKLTRPTTRLLDPVRGEEDHYSSASGPVVLPF